MSLFFLWFVLGLEGPGLAANAAGGADDTYNPMETSLPTAYLWDNELWKGS